MSRDLLGDAVTIYVLLDRDYRSAVTVHDLESRLAEREVKAHVWRRKELESYFLIPEAIARVSHLSMTEVEPLIGAALSDLRIPTQVGYVGRRQKEASYGTDPQAVMRQALPQFEELWEKPENRLALVPPKELLGDVANRCRAAGGRPVTARSIAEALKPTEVIPEMANLLVSVEQDLGSIIASVDA